MKQAQYSNQIQQCPLTAASQDDRQHRASWDDNKTPSGAANSDKEVPQASKLRALMMAVVVRDDEGDADGQPGWVDVRPAWYKSATSPAQFLGSIPLIEQRLRATGHITTPRT
jgi:hypothetical protein